MEKKFEEVALLYKDLEFKDNKPMLRCLSDITDEEQEGWGKISTTSAEAGGPDKMASLHWEKRMTYYRSLNIDCDGLIASGQAIEYSVKTNT